MGEQDRACRSHTHTTFSPGSGNAPGTAAGRTEFLAQLQQDDARSRHWRQDWTMLMAVHNRARNLAVAAATALAIVGLPQPQASAQLLWDWGGGTEVGDSGREIVRFSREFAPGHIVV